MIHDLTGIVYSLLCHLHKDVYTNANSNIAETSILWYEKLIVIIGSRLKAGKGKGYASNRQEGLSYSAHVRRPGVAFPITFPLHNSFFTESHARG